MTEEQKQTLRLFQLYVTVHAAVFMALPLTFSEFNDRVNWFAINAIPWWPLYKLGLPVSRAGWLVTPNTIGWISCALVWIGFYYLVARGSVHFLNRKHSA